VNGGELIVGQDAILSHRDGETAMASVLIIHECESIAAALAQQLRASATVKRCARAPQGEDGFGGELCGGYAGLLKEQALDTVVYAPPLQAGSLTPDLAAAETVLQQCAQAGVRHLLLLSSALVYGASPHNTGLMTEARPPLRNGHNPLGGQWGELEALAVIYLGERQLTMLRCAPVLARDGADYFSRLFTRRTAVTLPGHDPSLQLLSVDDLAQAVVCAVERSAGGIYNIAPDGVVPLRAALRLAGVRRLPIPRTLQRLAHSDAPLDFIRYPWTVSNQKSKDELGFAPQQASAETVSALNGIPHSALRAPHFDDFGMDEGYITAFGRTLFDFLSRRYWRIEVDGLGYVPRAGRAVLVGTHRGFMPWDAVMALHLIKQGAQRIPRFLIHPGLIKFPFLFNFHTKLGGIVACQENGDYVLERDELLAIYPEGINGAFRLYREAYQLGKFGRDEYVKMALRNRAPIIPFVNVGSAEIFPILKRLDWRWWKRWTEWPFFPITPTWPLAPLPLPSKWHIQFLPPIHLDHYPPEAADEPATVRAISQEVRAAMAAAMERLVGQRKHIFYGSVFESELR
jgi:1-acyl-sn-glycerol-3-phosphate acyltransferase